MPVRFRIIRPDADSLFPEGRKHGLGDVGPFVGVKRTVLRRDLVVGLRRVEHAKAIMMLGGKNHVTHAGVLRRARPLLRVELLRVKSLAQVFICRDIRKIIARVVPLSLAPTLVFRTDRPRLDDPPLAVGPPVHHQPELEVLPPRQLLLDGRILRRNIPLAHSMLVAHRRVRPLRDPEKRRHSDQ